MPQHRHHQRRPDRGERDMRACWQAADRDLRAQSQGAAGGAAGAGRLRAGARGRLHAGGGGDQGHSINGLFEALSRNGIEVISLRNKQNRLEQLFWTWSRPAGRRGLAHETLGRYWVAFSTILVKEILRFSRIWVQTVLPSAITTALYFVIFGRLIGERIGPMEGFRLYRLSSSPGWC